MTKKQQHLYSTTTTNDSEITKLEKNKRSNLRVGVHSFLLDVADEAVAGLGADEVREEEGVVHDPLADHDRKAEHRAGLLELEKGQQVHPFVFGLLQKGVDPPVVPANRPPPPNKQNNPAKHNRRAVHNTIPEKEMRKSVKIKYTCAYTRSM